MIFDKIKRVFSKQEKTVIEVGYFDGNEENLLPSK